MGMNDVVKFPDLSEKLESMLVKAVDEGIKKAEKRVQGRSMNVKGMTINVDAQSQGMLDSLEKTQKSIERKKENIQKTLEGLYDYKPKYQTPKLTAEQDKQIKSKISMIRGLTDAEEKQIEQQLKSEAKLINSKDVLLSKISEQKEAIKNGTFNSDDIKSYYENIMKLQHVMERLHELQKSTKSTGNFKLGFNLNDVVKELKDGGLERLLSKSYDNELNDVQNKIQQVFTSAQQSLLSNIIKENPLSKAIDEVAESEKQIKQAYANIESEQKRLISELGNAWKVYNDENSTYTQVDKAEEKIVKLIATLQKYKIDMSSILDINAIMEEYNNAVFLDEKTGKPTAYLDVINGVKNKVIDDNNAIIQSNNEVVESRKKYISSMEWVNDSTVRMAYGDDILKEITSETQSLREENERLKQSLSNVVNKEQFELLQSQLEKSKAIIEEMEAKIKTLTDTLEKQKASSEGLVKKASGDNVGTGAGSGNGNGTGSGTGNSRASEDFINKLNDKIRVLKELLDQFKTISKEKIISGIISDEDVSKFVSVSTSISDIARDLGRIDFTKLDVSSLNPDNINIFNTIVNNFKTSLEFLVTTINKELEKVKFEPDFNKQEFMLKVNSISEDLQKNPISIAINEIQLSAAIDRLKVNLANIADGHIIDNWQNQFMSAIDEIVAKIDRSFLNLERSSAKNMIQRWQNEQKLLNDTRTSYVTKKNKNGNEIIKKGGYGSLERKAFMNTKTGYITSDVYDQADHVTKEISMKLFDSAAESVNAALHSHPSGSAAFSPEDIDAMSYWISQGIVESYVVGAQKVAKIDLSGVSDSDIKRIANEYKTSKENAKKDKKFDNISVDDRAILSQKLLADSVDKVLKDNSGLSRVQTLDLGDFDTQMRTLENARNESQQLYNVIQKLDGLLDSFGNNSFTFGISEESLNSILDKLNEIVKVIKNIGSVSLDLNGLLSSYDENNFTKIKVYPEIDPFNFALDITDALRGYSAAIEVKPEIYEPTSFVNEIQNVINDRVIKVDVDVVPNFNGNNSFNETGDVKDALRFGDTINELQQGVNESEQNFKEVNKVVSNFIDNVRNIASQTAQMFSSGDIYKFKESSAFFNPYENTLLSDVITGEFANTDAQLVNAAREHLQSIYADIIGYLHSHPAKNASFSEQDLTNQINNFVNSGIYKYLVVASEEIMEIDYSQSNPTEMSEFVQRFSLIRQQMVETIFHKLTSNAIIDNVDTDNSFGSEFDKKFEKSSKELLKYVESSFDEKISSFYDFYIDVIKGYVGKFDISKAVHDSLGNSKSEENFIEQIRIKLSSLYDEMLKDYTIPGNSDGIKEEIASYKNKVIQRYVLPDIISIYDDFRNTTTDTAKELQEKVDVFDQQAILKVLESFPNKIKIFVGSVEDYIEEATKLIKVSPQEYSLLGKQVKIAGKYGDVSSYGASSEEAIDEFIRTIVEDTIGQINKSFKNFTRGLISKDDYDSSREYFLEELNQKIMGSGIEELLSFSRNNDLEIWTSTDIDELINKIRTHISEGLIEWQKLQQELNQFTNSNTTTIPSIGNKIHILSDDNSTDIGTTGMSYETTQAEDLRQKIIDVTAAVDAKTRAFKEEEQVVVGTVQREISTLEVLDGQLLEIINTIQMLQSSPIDLNIVGVEGDKNVIPDNVINNLKQLKELLNGLDPNVFSNINTTLGSLSIDKSVATNIKKLSNAITDLKESLNNVSASSFDFLSSIKELVNSGDALSNLVKVMEASKKEIQKAQEAAKQQSVANGASTSAVKTGKKTKNENNTSKSSNVKEVSSVEEAYKSLISSEERYQRLKAKVDTGKASNTEKEAFNVLIAQRDKYNEKIKEAITLTEKEMQLRNKYNQVSKEKKETVYDTMIETANSRRVDEDTAWNEANRINNALRTTQTLMDQIRSSKLNIDGFDKIADNVQNEINELNKKLTQGKIGQSGYEKQINKKLLDLDSIVGMASIDEAELKMREYLETLNNGKVKIDNTVSANNTLTATFKNQNGEIQSVTVQYNKVSGAIKKVSDGAEKSTSSLYKFMTGLKERATSLVQYLMTFVSFYEVWAQIKQGVNVIRELDTALTEIRKVSDESVQSLRNFQDASFDIASAVGTTAAQIQNSTADWMRLGESLNEASESAKVSNILLNVSEFESIDEATESLVSMSAAFDELDKIDIVDKLNLVGNNFAISTDGLATALQKSASALKTAGNDMDEAIALVTAGNQVVQDPDSVGAGLRTISLRITGTEAAKEELESLGEDTSDFVIQTSAKSQQAIKDFTRVASNNFQGFNILDDNGNFKSTYEILLGISEIYEEIIETDKQYGSNMANGLLETLAGKNRANIAASIIQNPQLLKEAYNASANDAEGSALKENEKYLDSIEGRIQLFQNRLQEFWYNLIDSDVIKQVVDAGTKLINILDNILSGLTDSGAVSFIVSFLTEIISLISQLTDGLGSFNTVLAGVLGVAVFKKKKGKDDSGSRVKKFTLIANMLPNRLAVRCTSSGAHLSDYI